MAPGSSRSLRAEALLTSSAVLALVVIAAWAAYRWLGAGPWYPLTTALVFQAGMSAAILFVETHHPFPRFGPANQVTTLRAGLVAMVVAAAAEPAPPSMAAALTAIAAVGTVLDGVDGWLARRTGLSSAFGARLDVETDSLFVLGLSVLVWRHDKVGAWILAGGLYRYAFVAAGAAFPWMAQPLRATRRAKVVAACHMLGLTVALAPIVPARISASVVAATLAALSWSFVVDVGRLRRGETT